MGRGVRDSGKLGANMLRVTPVRTPNLGAGMQISRMTQPRWRALLTPWNLVTVAILLWAAPRLLPHLGALVGIGSGDRRSPTWSATTLDGRPIGSDSLRGQVLLVNVWATWCFPCRAEMPLLQRMHDRHAARGFAVVGLSVDRGPVAEVEAFLRERRVTYPVAVVGEEAIAAFGGVRGYPTSFVVDRQGVVRHAVIGPLAPATLELAVRRLLEEGDGRD